MPYLNRYAFIGNLTKAPELRFQSTADKQALCLLNVAINRDSRDESGEKRSHTTFINDIEVWGASGENCAHYLTSGSMVMVEGRIDVDQWQDKQSGARRSRLKVVAENVQFLRIKRPDEAAAPVADSLESHPAGAAGHVEAPAATESAPADAESSAGSGAAMPSGSADPFFETARGGASEPPAPAARPARKPSRAGRAAR